MDGRPLKVHAKRERVVTDVPPSGIVARAVRAIRGLGLVRAPIGDVPSDIAVETRHLPWRLISFAAFVIAPGLAAILYLFLVASDQYVAEARAVVRSVEQESQSQSSSSPTGAGSSIASPPTTSNAYVVTNYIRSRAMVDDLGKTMNLREIFRRPEADFWARLPRDATIEELVEYWKQMTTTYVDGPSGIVTIRVRAFRPDDAQAMVQAVVKLSEALVNELSERARSDSMRFAEQEVRRADARVRASLLEMRRYRDEEGLIDPIKAADETAKLVMQLLAEKIKLESDLFVTSRSLVKDSPTVQNLMARLEIVEVQITKLKAKLTGGSPDVRNVAASLARFEELEVQRQFAEKLFTMAQDGLERARMTAERQSVYLIVFVPPSLPEESVFPRRLAFSILVPLALAVLWSIVALIWASVEDHRA